MRKARGRGDHAEFRALCKPRGHEAEAEAGNIASAVKGLRVFVHNVHLIVGRSRYTLLDGRRRGAVLAGPPLAEGLRSRWHAPDPSMPSQPSPLTV